jgi:glycine/D-amino acid oxidase-like deaminating enzyme
MTDFIIVGRGLAACTLMHTLREHELAFYCIGKRELSNCSQVAAGIWNPIVFKRLTKSWLAQELIDHLEKFYKRCEVRAGKKLLTSREIIRPFNETQEIVLWKKKAANELADFLDPFVHPPGELPLFARHVLGFGKVRQAGNLDVPGFLDSTTAFFSDSVSDETFNYKLLHIEKDHISYEGKIARAIIFCEGHLVSDNPFFSWLPLKPAKGEILELQLPEPGIGNSIFNRGAFLMQSSADMYRLGATYNWENLDDRPTAAGKEELLAKFSQMADLPFKIVDHAAGVRPSSADRRPIIGPHPAHSNVYVFNGLGTKGVMLAPYFANNFVNFYLQKQSLNAEASVKRFFHLYEEKK